MKQLMWGTVVSVAIACLGQSAFVFADALQMAQSQPASRATDKASAPAVRYPTKPLRIVVPQTPGSSVDFFARVVAERLNERWGVPVVVDNRPGAGGAISMEIVARATPDGYTLTLTTEGALAIIPHLYRNPR